VSPAAPPSRRQVLLSRPLLAVHAFAVLVIGTCLLAGLWQLDGYRNERSSATADRSGIAPAPVDQLLDVDEGVRSDVVGRRVVAQGTYAPADQQLLVAGREHDGRTGWWVLTPLLTDDDTALLVVRGWTDEPVLPAVPSGPVRVTAALSPGEESTAGARPTPTADTRAVDVIRLPSLVNVLPYRLYPAYGVRTDEAPAASDGLQPVSVPAPEPSWRTGSRSLAYGLQWWAFAAFALFMWWRVVADRLHGAPEPGVPPSTS
jgi:cytochrome oxidase assembly protein ShyY1